MLILRFIYSSRLFFLEEHFLSLPSLTRRIKFERRRNKNRTTIIISLLYVILSLSNYSLSLPERFLESLERDTWRCFRSARWTANIFKHVFNFKYRSWRKLSPFEYLTRFIGADFTKVKKKKSRRTFPASQGCIFPRESVYKSEERRGK